MKKSAPGTVTMVLLVLVMFAVEISTNSVANDAGLLKLGALPDDGQLHAEYWRLIAYSFLHYNWAHLLINSLLLWWVGRIVERQVGTLRAGAIYFASVLLSALLILFVHVRHPKSGVTVGASGAIFGLVVAALVFSYRSDEVTPNDKRLRRWLWIVVLTGFAISFLPDISMAGHIGGSIGGLIVALLLKPAKSESPT
jgi:rhomboid protease GluP